MSEIKKISVDGVVYDIASTTSENPGEDIQIQINELNSKTEELDEKIISESSRVDSMIDQVNQNVASSIQTLNDNLVQAIDTINGGISAEVSNREEGDKKLSDKIEEERTAVEEIKTSLDEITKKIDSIDTDNITASLEEESRTRALADTNLEEKIDSSVKALNETIAEVNQNTASSIQVLNDNLVQAVNTINGGIDNEIRPELEKSVKYKDFTYNGETRKTIELENYDSLSGLDTNGNGHNLAMVSKWNKADFGSGNIQMNLNSSGRVTVNDTEELAYLSDVATDQDFESLKAKVEENTTKIEETNTTLVDAVGSLNESINTKTEELNTRIDTEVLQKISELDKNKVGLVEADKNGIKTQNIVLENYASVLGKDTQGSMYNLAMVSKWNKADFGSASIVLNFNGSETRPTYNDSEELALLSDISGNFGEINLVKKSDLEYELQVGDRIAGTINIPEDQFFKGSEYNPETHILTLTFKTSEGDQSQDINLSGLIDVYTAGNGLSLEGKVFSIKLDQSTESYLEVTENGLRLVGIQEALNLKATTEDLSKEIEARTSKDTELQNNIESEANARIEKDTELEESLSKKVEFVDIADQNLPNRKAIVLPTQGDIILSNTEDGGNISLIQYNRWGIVDLGTATKPINLNTPKGIRPTVQEAGQSGEDAYSIAYTSDLGSLSTKEEVESKVNELNEKLDSIIIPTKVSELENDSKYQTEEEVNNRIKEVVGAAPEALDTLEEIATKLADNDDAVAIITNQIATRASIEDLNKEISDRQENDNKLEEALSKKVDLVDISTEDNPGRKAIVLANHDTILGTTTEGSTPNLLMLSKWNKADIGSSQVELNLNGSAERPTYNDDVEIALISDIENLKESVEINIPIRTLKDEVYDQETILSWFGVSDIPELKIKITREGQFYLRYGISLSSNPMYYRMPIQYVAFESANQIKLVTVGLDTSNDVPTKYEILINLDGTIIEGNSNIKLTTYDLVLASEIDSINEKIDNITVPTKVSELENDSQYQTAQDVDNRIQNLINAAPEELDTLGEIATALKDNESVVGAITTELSNKANKSDIPTKLPNPGALTIKYNGTVAFTYDGSTPETGNFVVNAEEIPLSEEDTTTISDKLNTLATIQSLNSEIEARTAEDTKLQSDLQNESVTARAAEKANSDAISEIKNDLSQFKAPYRIDLNTLNSASDSDSISDAIGGIDNLRNVVSENRTIIGEINNGTVSVSIRILGNITTVYYVLDSLVGYTLNEINIQNNSGSLTKEIKVHSVMSEEMVIDNLTSTEKTLPLSANQGKVLDEKISKKGMYYQGVKVDTQKLFALTKDSTEDDIKAALKLEAASGGYTLPTAEMLDDCLGKGYQLLSNWMPVSVAWNGAAYVLYVVGQSYMMKPTGLYTVSISINDGVYSVFQAAKFEEFVNVDDLDQYQKIDYLTYQDDWTSAKAKIANGVKTIIDNDNLQWTITSVKEEPINEVNSLKVIATRSLSPYSDDIDTKYGIAYAQFTLAENAVSGRWSRVTANKSFLSTSDIDSEINSKVIGDLDLSKYLNDSEYSCQILNKLEQSYIDDLGLPENINGKPYNADTNNYSIGTAYISFAKFDESLVFHYDLFALNKTFNLGYFGKIFQAIKLNMDTYDSKLSALETRIKALESPTE